MKKLILSFAVVAVLAAGAFAVAQEPKPAAPDAAAAKQPEAAKKAKPPVKKQPQEEEEEGGVMIDSRAEGEEAGRFAAQPDAAEADRPEVPGGLPSSYGQCKGVINDGGRNLLVFESIDDGTIYFVQVVFGKNGATWKPAGSLPRSAD